MNECEELTQTRTVTVTVRSQPVQAVGYRNGTGKQVHQEINILGFHEKLETK